MTDYGHNEAPSGWVTSDTPNSVLFAQVRVAFDKMGRRDANSHIIRLCWEASRELESRIVKVEAERDALADALVGLLAELDYNEDTMPEWGMYGATCGTCGRNLTIVRPGKYQCDPMCEQVSAAKAALAAKEASCPTP